MSLRIPPSTTLALALDCGPDWRFVLLGDSGIRLNGTEVLRKAKLIDDVSTHARVAIFAHVQIREPDPDRAEMATRRAIFLGSDQAVAERVLDGARARAIIDDTVLVMGLAAHAAIVTDFLQGGIRSQQAHANVTGHPLCFGTMNGAEVSLGDLIDVTRPKVEASSIELVTDGYPTLPEAVSLSACEDAFAAAETLDFHKSGPLATVKGSTSTEFFDDRTVIVLSGERLVLCFEAGHDGFWPARFLLCREIEVCELNPASLQVNRRARRVKTDRIDVLSLLNAILAIEPGGTPCLLHSPGPQRRGRGCPTVPSRTG